MKPAQFFQTLENLTKGYSLRSQENEDEPLFVVKLFDFAWSGTWYLTEYDPETHIGFGYFTGLAFDEWGSVSIDELAELRWRGIPRIEIDRFFKKTRSSELINRD